jgi:hypothetical protein
MLVKSLLLSAALFTGLAPLGPPPIKMGLWEQTTTMDMSGPNMPAGMGHQVMKMRNCLTTESWMKALQNRSNTTCERKNESMSGGHYSLDLVCKSMNGHIDMNFTTPESGSGSVNMQTTDPKMSMTVKSTTDMHFVSASCGSVTPDKPEIVR